MRHYHRIGLLPEPERDHSGYRSYEAAAVVRLIRIHMLADAGVPLARVHELLDADPREFAEGVREIDAKLRADIRRLRTTRERLARLAAGEQLTLPASIVDYESAPASRRLLTLLEERGWRGWTCFERVPGRQTE